MATHAPETPILPCLISHIGLPPHIPAQQEDPTETSRLEQGMIDVLRRACLSLKQSLNGSLIGEYDQIDRILQNTKAVHNGGILEKASILTQLRALQDVPLLIHVTEQNAGLIIRRETR